MVDDDGRTPDHGHPISSPSEPNGSGELTSSPKGNNGSHENQQVKLLVWLKHFPHDDSNSMVFFQTLNGS